MHQSSALAEMDPVLADGVTGSARSQRSDLVGSELSGMAQVKEIPVKEKIRRLRKRLCPFRVPAEGEVKFPLKLKRIAGPDRLPRFLQFKDRSVIDPFPEVRGAQMPELMGALSAAAAVMTAVEKIKNVKPSLPSERNHVADPGVEAERRVVLDREIADDPAFRPADPGKIVGQRTGMHGRGKKRADRRSFVQMAGGAFRTVAVHDDSIAENLKVDSVKQDGKFMLFCL